MSRRAHRTPVDRPGVALAAVAIALLLISGAHLCGLDAYSLRRVAAALVSFAGGGALLLGAQAAYMLGYRTAVAIALMIAGTVLLAVPLTVFWVGR